MNEDTRMSMMWSWCLYCEFSTYFTSCCSVSVVEFKQVNAQWVAPYTIAMEATISKINIVVKNVINEQELHLTSLNHLIYASAVISKELCNVKIKTPKRNVPKNLAW